MKLKISILILLIAFGTVVFVIARKAEAASEGPSNPGTMADDAAVGTVAWGDFDNAKASDDSYAITTSNNSYVSHYLKATNFGFSIPVGATIDGILVEVEKFKDGVGNGGTTDEHIKIVKSDGSIGAENKADTSTEWPVSDSYVSYGGAADLWSEAWGSADINHANFGAVVSSDVVKLGAPPTAAESKVDHIRITVYYTSGAAAPAAQIINVICD